MADPHADPGHLGIVGAHVGTTGTVGGHLSIGAGVSLTSLQWTITNGGVPTTGTIPIGSAQSVEWVAGGIPAGSGYTLSVTGNDGQGDGCSGSTMPFTVMAGASVQVILTVTCVIPTDSAVAADIEAGPPDVDGSVGNPPVDCPGITSLSINPAEQVAGVPVQLGLMTTGPTPLVTWTVSPAGDGSFSDVHAASPTFTCTNSTQNPLTITATISLSDGGVCSGPNVTTVSAFFTCDSSAPDAAADAADADTDAGAGGEVTACITPPCAAGGPNSVQCAASPNGVCTPTEAIIVAHDILKNGQLAGANLASSCYTCLVANACLDASGSGPPPAGNGSGTAVTNSECGDPNGPGLNPPFDNPNVSATNVPNCLDALRCALTTNGTNPASECTLSQLPASVSNCYCGANTGSSCLSSPASPIGACASNIATDVGSTDPTTVLSHFTDPTFSPGGVGLAILNCGLTAPATPPAAAKCPTCFN